MPAPKLPRTLALTLALATAMAAFAPAAARAAQPLSISAYNDALVTIGDEVMERIEDAEERFAHLEPGPRYDAWRSSSLEAIAEGLGRIDAIPAREDDAGFHAAVRDGFVTTERVVRELVSEAFALTTKDGVVDADLARLEQIYRELDAEVARVSAALLGTQRAFAERHGMRLVTRRPQAPEAQPPDFVAPGLPPAGSRLAGQVHASFAVRYRNALLPLQRALSGAANSVVQAEPDEMERARKAALERVREVRERAEAAAPWQGDATLRAGALEMARLLEQSLTGPTAEYAKLLRRRDEFDAADVARANAAGEELNLANRRAHAAFAQAEQAFRERWSIDAYLAWAQASADAERERIEARERRERRGESI